MTTEANYAALPKPASKSRRDRGIQAADIRAITLDDLWQKIVAYPEDARAGLIGTNLIEELQLDVSATVREIYANWSTTYRTQFNIQLVQGADPATSVLTPEQRRITELAFGLPVCEDPGPLPASDDIERAYLAVALELRAYYEREDDEDEGPLWCKKSGCKT